ncbi:hypothetical protein CRG98_001929 [Punica granatum]|uniref:Uncharacterized protein n=1 Tax=Punica granatum TaxID=22663 RepID=A0A2I0LAJ1_PUNGR|nr:hypothetical protein CRG98_001929 [Punica granatum]
MNAASRWRQSAKHCQFRSRVLRTIRPCKFRETKESSPLGRKPLWGDPILKITLHNDAIFHNPPRLTNDVRITGTKHQELWRTLIRDPTGHVGAHPQSWSPSSQDRSIPGEPQPPQWRDRLLAEQQTIAPVAKPASNRSHYHPSGEADIRQVSTYGTTSPPCAKHAPSPTRLTVGRTHLCSEWASFSGLFTSCTTPGHPPLLAQFQHPFCALCDSLPLSRFLCIRAQSHLYYLVRPFEDLPSVRTRMCSRRGLYACDRIARLGSFHFPRERVTDKREKESPLPVYDRKVEGR